MTTTLITGANRSLGYTTAERLIAAGHDVIVGARDEQKGRDAAQQLGARFVQLDVTDDASIARAAAEIDHLDVLVNNAGILLAGKFEDIDVARHQKEIDVNVRGVVNGAHAAHPHLKPGSTLVNLCSASAIYGQAELANYSATKFFVRGLTEALDIEWGPQGIRVVALWPLFVQTAMLEGVRTGTTDTLGVRLGPQDVADEILATVEPGRAARAIHQVHFPVGRQTQVLSVASRFSPAWLTRVVNKRFAAH